MQVKKTAECLIALSDYRSWKPIFGLLSDHLKQVLLYSLQFSLLGDKQILLFSNFEGSLRLLSRDIASWLSDLVL